MAEILPGLRKQRGARKRRLTTLRKKLDEFATTDVREQDFTTLQTLKKAIEREFSAHRDIQEKIEEALCITEEDDTIEVETSHGLDYNAHYEGAIAECDRNINNYQLFHELTALASNYEEWHKVAKPATKNFVRDAKEFLIRIDEIDRRLRLCTLSEVVQHKHEEVLGIRGHINTSLYTDSPEPEVKPSRTDRVDIQTKLNLELPTFNGDPLQWQAFQRLFEATLEHRARHLNNEEKACLLLRSLKDPAAKDLAALYTSAPDGFDKAIAALVERYGRPSVLLPKIVRRIQPNTTFSLTRESLFALSKQYCLPKAALDQLKVDLSMYMAADAATKFDAKLHEEWIRHTASMTSLPTIETLTDYITQMTSRLEDLAPAPTTNSQPSASFPPKKTTPSKGKPVNRTTTTDAVQSSHCTLCNGRVHSLTKCPKFVEMTPEQRSKFVRDQRWCTNCLYVSHTQQNCASQHTCRHCGLRHHTMLHRGAIDSTHLPAESNTAATNLSAPTGVRPSRRSKPVNRETPSSRQGELPATQTEQACLDTALIEVQHQQRYMTARLAFDSGASVNFITEDLATRLQLKRFPQHLIFEGANSGGSSKFYVQTILRSRHDPSQTLEVRLSVIQCLPKSPVPPNKSIIVSDPGVKTLKLADEELGGSIDILLGNYDSFRCQRDNRYLPNLDVGLRGTIFGWTIVAKLGQEKTSKLLNIQTVSDTLDEHLTRLWELEKTPEDNPNLSADDNLALEQFQDSHEVLPSGRYRVKLPRPTQPPQLGNSRNLALKRFHANEKTLDRKGCLEEFNRCMYEYLTLGHAELAPPISVHPTNYLPVHGVFKDNSTTTKLRPVFDASARTSTGISFNDSLLTGPNLYPQLVDILIQFRVHVFGMSADISKMFREIELHPSERDYHRFLMRNDQGQVSDYRMKRLTFGVRPSPFLATQVLRHLAETHQTTHPRASKAIMRAFYVDDFLGGADSLEEATLIREELCSLLSSACMTLRKWRSSNSELLATIPEELIETEPLNVKAPTDSPKALGIHWDVSNDNLHLSVPTPNFSSKLTKRIVASMAAQVYDVLGLFSPFTISAKILLQVLWKCGLSWDKQVPDELRAPWDKWQRELETVHSHPIPRRYTPNSSPVTRRTLHGFSDASEVAYGAVIYIKQEHQDGSVSTSIIMSKARVSPLKTLTIPRAELVGAHLLVKLLNHVRILLDIPLTDIHAWTDSTIVLGWIRKPPSALKSFAAHRVAYIQETLPDISWRHVPTHDNPADILSRGSDATSLLSSRLWWEGPSWLQEKPTQWPENVFSIPKTLPEIKSVVLTVCTTEPVETFHLWDRFSSFSHLTRVVAWIKRFTHNCQTPTDKIIKSPNLSAEEQMDAEVTILKHIQKEHHAETLQHVRENKTLPASSPFRKFHLTTDSRGLLLITGRVRNPKTTKPQHLILLSIKSTLTKMLVRSAHEEHHHPGTSTLMAILAETYHIPALKGHLKLISRNCVICQKAYAQPTQPPMGLLPTNRTTPSPPFQTTGLDFAGPFTIRKGHTQKPVLLKCYACIFVCFSTKATHIELCSDLTTEALMAALTRFCARRGTPRHIHSDNGTNFIGAAAELRQIQDLLQTSEDTLSRLQTIQHTTWHFIPPRAPHFGGLWEAGVKQMKRLLKKHLPPHPLTFEELTTILTDVEATLNSRPITAMDSTDPDNIVLTPGHFLIGRPLRALPSSEPPSNKITHLKRWQLVRKLTYDIWTAWHAYYLTSLQGRPKWNKPSKDLKTGDIVLVKDETLKTSTSWPVARVIQLHPGTDRHTRAVELKCNGRVYSRASNRLVYLLSSQLNPDST